MEFLFNKNKNNREEENNSENKEDLPDIIDLSESKEAAELNQKQTNSFTQYEQGNISLKELKARILSDQALAEDIRKLYKNIPKKGSR